jgi:tetratricopeptide (TPR) repeat protein
VAARWPANGEARYYLARACRLSGGFAAARQHLQEAEARGWPQPEIDRELLLIEAQLAAKLTPDNALSNYILQHTAEEPLVLEALVAGGMRTNRLDFTMVTLMHWMKYYPGDWRPYFLRGLHSLDLGLMEPAQMDFEKSLALNPDHLETHLRLGQAVQKLGFDYRNAASHLERFLNGQSEASRLASPAKESDALLALARCQWALNEPDAARATLDRLFAHQPNHIGGLLYLAQLEFDVDRPQEALATLRRADTAGINDLQLLFEFAGLSAQVNRVAGNIAEATAWENKLKRISADLTELSVILVDLRRNSGNIEKQRKVGLLYLSWGVERQAMRWFDPILRAHPDDPIIHQALADFYARRSDDASQRLAAEHRRRVEGRILNDQ